MTPAHSKRGPPAPAPPPPRPAVRPAPLVKLPPPLPGFVADRVEAVARVERLLRYQFRDRALIEEALTHPSFSNPGASYQRLEFLGDSALGLAFTNFIYLTNPTLGPGGLSTLRSANVSTEKLARVAVRHDLYPLLRRNCARLDLLVGQFIESVKQELKDDLATAPYGGRMVKAPKVLADIVESIAAAVYVDCKFDLEKFWKITRWLFEPIIMAETIDEQPVTTLLELCQKRGKDAQFKTWQKGGITVVNVFVGGEMVGLGSSEQKVIAKLNAARDALGKLVGDAKQQVLISRVGHGSGDEMGELRECKHKLTEQCITKHWPKPILKLLRRMGASPSSESRMLRAKAAGEESILKQFPEMITFSQL